MKVMDFFYFHSPNFDKPYLRNKWLETAAFFVQRRKAGEVRMTIDFCNRYAFKVFNFKYVEDPVNLIIESLAVLVGDYAVERKMAAILILKILLTDAFRETLLNETSELYPFSRNDYRVREWKAQVLLRGVCEICGANESLEAHHIIRWSDYPQGRIDIENGACLCTDCHAKQHEADGCADLVRARKKALRKC